jgi:hypothetical protein
MATTHERFRKAYQQIRADGRIPFEPVGPALRMAAVQAFRSRSSSDETLPARLRIQHRLYELLLEGAEVTLR